MPNTEMKNNKWKNFLLKSGLPLEYEINEILREKGCISSVDHSYFRNDENFLLNEFSFDIYSSYIKGHHFFNLLIECKYRDESTNWVFLPSHDYYVNELESTSFLHANDHFNENVKFIFPDKKLDFIGKVCSKGIEINSEGQNPKTITQGVNQLSYAMADIIVDGMYNQIEKLFGKTEMIFYDVPIIVTTANLYRIKDNVTIDLIKSTEDILEIATKEDCLTIDVSIGKDLERHNNKIFKNFITKYGVDTLESKLNSFNKDVEFVFDVLASTFSPRSILVVNHSIDSSGFEKIFKFMDEIVKYRGQSK